MAEEDQLEEFKSHLNLIKSMTGDKAEQEFYQLMEKAKTTLGQLSLDMGFYYFEYAKFLLEKMEKNIDIFNATSLPVGQQAVQQNPIPEDFYEDDSSLENQSQEAKSQNNANAEAQSPTERENNKNVQNNEPLITEDNANGKEEKQQQPQKNENQVGKQGQVQGTDDDDYQVCAENLLCAIKIFETERDRLVDGGEQGKYTLNEIKSWISRCKSRLGDLHQLCQNYNEAVSVYRQVIQAEEQKPGHQSNRGLAEIHYMVANSFLYDNKEGCEKIAIQQFIKSVEILLNHLSLLNPQDKSLYEIPSMQKIKVDRFAYLPKSADNEETKQIKQVISCLLDKIEDTYEQIAIRAQYEAQKIKNKEEQSQNKFKQVDPTTITVVKLGTFGNRKKKPEQLPDIPPKKDQV